MSHKGIHDRGYLPHWDFDGSLQAVTFRLADSVPAKVICGWRCELQTLLESSDKPTSQKAALELQRRIAKYEDAGYGSCLLARHAPIIQNLLIADHYSSYKLIEWCIMPNHVHVLIRLLDGQPLGNLVKKWKASSAIQINRIENRTGSLWAPDYHDRFIRDFDHYYNAIAYIRNNPVKARLCSSPTDYLWSGIGQNWTAEFIPPLNRSNAE
ncbi:MAG: transposase [Akkermansiaceae bacterium]|nr:transposase [Akkermansiaceae bacterium]